MNAVVTVSDHRVMESPTLTSNSVILIEPSKYHWTNTISIDAALMNAFEQRYLRWRYCHMHKGRRKSKRGYPYRYRPR